MEDYKRTQRIAQIKARLDGGLGLYPQDAHFLANTCGELIDRNNDLTSQLSNNREAKV